MGTWQWRHTWATFGSFSCGYINQQFNHGDVIFMSTGAAVLTFSCVQVSKSQGSVMSDLLCVWKSNSEYKSSMGASLTCCISFIRSLVSVSKTCWSAHKRCGSVRGCPWLGISLQGTGFPPFTALKRRDLVGNIIDAGAVTFKGGCRVKHGENRPILRATRLSGNPGGSASHETRQPTSLDRGAMNAILIKHIPPFNAVSYPSNPSQWPQKQ